MREHHLEIPDEFVELRGELKRSLVERLTPYETAREFIEKAPELTKKISKREAVLQKRLWPELPENHQTVAAVREIVSEVLERSGLPRDFLSVIIFDSSYPDVHIQLYEREFRMSRYFLELVKGDRDAITAVVAHEVGHVLLSHYRIHGSDSPDPLDERIQGYEHEYQADHAAVILTNRMGIRPDKLADALSLLEQDLYSREALEGIYDEFDFNHRAWILSTHPHTARRVLAIKRESASLPRYQLRNRQPDVYLPRASDFSAADINKWGNVGEMSYYDMKQYHDCLWEEMPPPQALEKYYSQQYPNIPEYKLVSTPDEVIENETSNTEPLDALPEEVSSWTKKDMEKIDVWWSQAMKLMSDKVGYQDLSVESAEYAPAAVYALLERCCPEYSAVYEWSREPEMGTIPDPDVVKDHTKRMQLALLDDYQASPELRTVVSLLIRNLFEKDESLQTAEGMRGFCNFLRQFSGMHGAYLPYTGARYFIRLEELYMKASTESERANISNLCREYQEELLAGTDVGIPLARASMPKITAFLDECYPGQFYTRSWAKQDALRAWRTAYQLSPEIRLAAEGNELTAERARALITKIPKNFRPENLTQIVIAAVREEDKRIDEEGYSDHTLEATPEFSAVTLTSEEFDRKYFGAGRKEYQKAEYSSLDKNIMEYMDALKLWQKAGYETDFARQPPGMDKVSFLLETLPVRSSFRDTMIARSLGWSEIKYVEDIISIQEKILVSENPHELFLLSDKFSNPLLTLAVSQRLWQLYEHGTAEFFQKVPEQEMHRVDDELKNLPENLRSDRLRAILLCYREPTYVRDELLRPLVDAALDQEATLSIASWYCEPPPGVLRPRSGEVVAVTETLLDTMRGMEQLEKQELFLYFLGHRRFYSGIDSRYFYTLRQTVDEARADAIYMTKVDFKKKYKIEREPLDYENPEERSVAYRKYMVDSPDSLIFLTKTSGIPVELLLKQQRLTTTRREQREFMSHLLVGNGGVLKQENKEKFIVAAARNIVDSSSWSKEQSESEKQAMVDLLAFALNNCPEDRLPDLFIGLWNLQQDKGSLPSVVATLLRELGPLFIKAGQYLGTQSSALPPEWLHAFRGLSDENMRAEKTLVYEHERAVYGEDSPLASIGEKQGEGSMAAVYKGVLKAQSGESERDVAVKVFHPNIREELKQDVEFLDKLVKFINSRRGEFKVRLPDNLAAVGQGQIDKELTFENILNNSESVAGILKKSKSSIGWRVPKMVRELSRPGFIISEFSAGQSIDKVRGAEGKKIRGEVAMEILRQILYEGIYQGDPNPGNFKASRIEKRQRVDWLDTDHVGRFSQPEMKDLRKFVGELATSANLDEVATILNSFVAATEDHTTEIKQWVQENNILQASSIENMEGIFTSFLDFLAERKLVLKEQHVTLLRTLGLMKPLLADVTSSQILPFVGKLMLKR